MSNNSDKSSWPPGWIREVSKSYPDKYFYFNTLTGETQWKPPVNMTAKSITTIKSNINRSDVSRRSSDTHLLKGVNSSSHKICKTPAQNRLQNLQKELYTQQSKQNVNLVLSNNRADRPTSAPVVAGDFPNHGDPSKPLRKSTLNFRLKQYPIPKRYQKKIVQKLSDNQPESQIDVPQIDVPQTSNESISTILDKKNKKPEDNDGVEAELVSSSSGSITTRKRKLPKLNDVSEEGVQEKIPKLNLTQNDENPIERPKDKSSNAIFKKIFSFAKSFINLKPSNKNAIIVPGPCVAPLSSSSISLSQSSLSSSHSLNASSSDMLNVPCSSSKLRNEIATGEPSNFFKDDDLGIQEVFRGTANRSSSTAFINDMFNSSNGKTKFSVNDRLDAIRKQRDHVLLDEDYVMSSENEPGSGNAVESMDWKEIGNDAILKEITRVRYNDEYTTSPQSVPECRSSLTSVRNFELHENELLQIVIDTNVFFANLTLIEDMIRGNFDAPVRLKINIPYIVIKELDNIKTRRSNETLSMLACRAIRFLNNLFKEQRANVKGQSAIDDQNHLVEIDNPDDRIINCCLQLKSSGTNRVILLSNDVNLRNKALCNDLAAFGKGDLISILRIKDAR